MPARDLVAAEIQATASGSRDVLHETFLATSTIYPKAVRNSRSTVVASGGRVEYRPLYRAVNALRCFGTRNDFSAFRCWQHGSVCRGHCRFDVGDACASARQRQHHRETRSRKRTEGGARTCRRAHLEVARGAPAERRRVGTSGLVRDAECRECFKHAGYRTCDACLCRRWANSEQRHLSRTNRTSHCVSAIPTSHN